MKQKASKWENLENKLWRWIDYYNSAEMEEAFGFQNELINIVKQAFDQQKQEMVEMVRGLDWKFVSGNEGDTNNPFSDENKWVRRDDIIKRLEENETKSK